VFIAGRRLDAHRLGVYTTALFLSQILVNKFVPALNEVAFPTYARMQDDKAAVTRAFARAVRIVMIAAMPFCLGLAVAAEPVVLTLLGPKWAETVSVIRVLGLAMPFVTLQILFHPVTNALGRPSVGVWVAAAGAVLMPGAFAIGVRFGEAGMAWAWLAAFPFLTIITAWLSLPVIGLRARELLAAIRPSVFAGALMALTVVALDSVLPPLDPLPHLLALAGTGAVAYALALAVLAPAAVAELIGLARGRKAAIA